MLEIGIVIKTRINKAEIETRNESIDEFIEHAITSSSEYKNPYVKEFKIENDTGIGNEQAIFCYEDENYVLFSPGRKLNRFNSLKLEKNRFEEITGHTLHFEQYEFKHSEDLTEFTITDTKEKITYPPFQLVKNTLMHVGRVEHQKSPLDIAKYCDPDKQIINLKIPSSDTSLSNSIMLLKIEESDHAFLELSR